MSKAITSVEYEFLYTTFRHAKVHAEDNTHWSARTGAERLQEAIATHPDDVARYLDLGEYWLNKGNFIRAAHAFGAAHELDPDKPEIVLRRAAALVTLDPEACARDIALAVELGASPPSLPEPLVILEPKPSENVAPIYADVTDMIDYLGINTTFSGIQRVVANIFRQVRLGASPNARDVIPVMPDYRNNVMFAADVSILDEMIDTVERGRASRLHLDRLLVAFKASLRTVEPRAGDIFLMAGAFWILHSYDYLKELRQNGVVVSIFIHDLIQIDNPEYVHAAATEAFRRSLVDVAEISSFITTNSNFVAQEVRRFLDQEMGMTKPVYPVPLATEMGLVPPEPWQDAALQAEFGENGYVLCVCTLEIRKNHIFLFRIWQELQRRRLKNLPTLVFVGKWGWEIDQFRELLERTNYLDGAIKIMAAVSDTLLASLYRNCRFTIYPSFAEGWGLPIGESLVFGKPCIASGVTSMPEVGGDLVRYVDPLDLATGLREVERLLSDPEVLEVWTEDVRTRFRPRRWVDFTEHLLGATRALAAEDEVPPALARLLPGEIAIVGQEALQAAADAGRSMRTARMARDRGWHHLEDSGAWSVRPVATLRFVAEGCMPGTPIRIVVLLRGESKQAPIACELSSTVETTSLMILPSQPTPLAVQGVVGADCAVEVAVIARGDAIRAGDKDVYVNVSGLGYHRLDDSDEKLALMESLTFDR